MNQILKPKKKKKSPYKKAKDKAWGCFSKYIRLRDCIRTTGTVDQGKCCSCDREYDFKELHAGHFISGRHNSILFNEKGCHAQCYSCNMYKSGNEARYSIFMLHEYGEQTIFELAFLDKQVTKFTISDLLEIAEIYKNKYQKLLKENT